MWIIPFLKDSKEQMYPVRFDRAQNELQIPTDGTKYLQSLSVFTLRAHPGLCSNAVITCWGEAACLRCDDVLFLFFFHVLLKRLNHVPTCQSLHEKFLTL